MRQLERAATALGWDGLLLRDVEVLGARFAAVARLRPEVHQWRTEHGWPPESDPDWFRAWSEPDDHDHLPVPAVELQGILVPVTKMRHGLRACGTLMTLAPCAVTVPGDQSHKTWRLIELDYYGIGVVAAHPDTPAHVLLRPEDRTSEFGSSLFTRWLLEVLYERIVHPEHESAGTS